MSYFDVYINGVKVMGDSAQILGDMIIDWNSVKYVLLYYIRSLPHMEDIDSLFLLFLATDLVEIVMLFS